ncbi:MAG: ParA family protein [Polyangiaceae bacterium]
MAAISETCSVCGTAFDMQFRYQMEERGEGFSFFCSQRCLEQSQVNGGDGAAGAATCDACATRFQPDLVSQVFYVGGRRRYACSLDCRGQVLREESGVRLGEIAAESAPVTVAVALPTPRPAAVRPATAVPVPVPVTTPRPAPVRGPATAVPTLPASATPAPAAVRTAPAAPAVAARVTATLTAAEPRRIEGDARARELSARGLPRVLAIFNHKGGTGKTTTAVSVAAGLATRGHRVLLVDTDAQGNVSVSLGATSERSLYHVLVMGLRVADATREVRPNLDLLPSNETLAAAELYLAGRQNRDRVLSERLTAASAGYDYVVLDCSPSLSLMNQNALVFADSVLVPVACDYLSLVGVRQVIKTVKNVNALLHHPVQIWGVLPTFYDARAKISREAVATLKGHFGDRCLSPVRAAIKVKEAPAHGQTIFEYAEGASAAEDYLKVVERIVEARAASLQPSAQVVVEAGARAGAGMAAAQVSA